MNNKVKKIGAILFLFLMIFSSFFNVIYASSQMSEAYIQKVADAPQHLQHYNASKGAYTYVICSVVGHNQNGVFYPAYCLNHDLNGAETGAYTVDIDAAYNNPAVWRVIKNGYPYNNMGLSDWDAFVVTKMAVYCVLGQSNLGDFRAAPGDGTADAMLAQLHNLVNIGLNGGENPTNNTVSINKNGELVEDGDYYSQTYTVSSSVAMSQYTVTGIANFPEGTRIANVNGADQTTFSSGEAFKIMIPASGMTQDINGAVAVQAKCQTYPILYGRTRVPGTQDYMVTMDPYGDDSGNGDLNVKTNTGRIEIVKNDAETNLPIEGVTFALMKQDGTVIATATTDANGQATFSELYQSDYILKEISTNDNYILNEQEFPISVKYNKTTPITITNEHKRGDLTVYKVDKDNNKIDLGNVEFQLYSVEFGKVIGTYHTDVNGKFEVKSLRTGDYKLIETTTNQWYDLTDDTNVKVEWNIDNPVTVENELKKGQVRIIKVDMDDNEEKLKGVEFEVLDENDKVLETLVTDENGEALTNKYPIRDFEKLKVRETKTLDTYLLSDKVETIVLEGNQITDIVFENEKIKGKVEITKVDKDDNSKVIEGVTFGLYDENDNLIETLVTDSQGIATSDYIYKGKYYLKELDTGSIYYLLNENKYEFEIVNHKETVPVTIDNEGVDIEVKVEKEGTTEVKPGEKVDYTFTNVGNASNVYLDNFKWFDYIPTDYEKLEKMTTGTWNQELTYDVYYKTNKSEDYVLFREDLSTNENYDLDFTTIEFGEDEYITETCFDFGKVDVGFKESVSPTMQCKSFDTLQDGQTFTNHTKTVGIYGAITAEANSKWTTIVHTPVEIPTNIPNSTPEQITLPRTGK